MLKILLAAWMVGLTGLMATPAEAIEDGDTREAVIDELGEPDGGVTMGGTEFLYYQRGQVEIKDGKVSNNTIVSQAEADELAEKRKEEEAKYFAAIEQQKAKRKAAAEKAAADKAAAAPDEEEAKEPTAEDIARKAAIEAKIQEEMKNPGIKTSSRKLRKYRRGRSKSAIEEREAQLRKQYEED